MTKPNPLIAQAAEDWLDNDHKCFVCGSTVSVYACHPLETSGDIIKYRPEAVEEDWWVACDNADCAHAYGQGTTQWGVSWVRRFDKTLS